MSTKYPGGFITKSPVAPTTTAASGVWTLDQQQQYQKAGTWPAPPIFIEDLFSMYLYTSTGSDQTITNGIDLTNKGGLVWVKSRSNVKDNVLVDTVRGISRSLVSNTTGSEDYSAGNYVNAFSTTGFGVGGIGSVGGSGSTFATWTFAEQPKFFDVVTWTSANSATARTISHNLGSTPGCVIIKSINNNTNSYNEWYVAHRYDLTAQGYLNRNYNFASGVPIVTAWTDTTVTFTANFNEGVGNSYIVYIFAHNAGGFPASGSGSNNAITCGSFTTAGSGGLLSAPVDLGYEPQWLLVKNFNSTEDWKIYDTSRGMAYSGYSVLYPNLNSGEAGGTSAIVPTATGFSTPNASGPFANSATYIYIAIRKGPMKTPTTGTSVFETVTSSASAGTALTTGFPVDLQMQAFRSTTGAHRFMDRLRGVSTNSTAGSISLASTSTAVETTSGSYSLAWNNTGFQMTTAFESTSGVFWNFQRAPSFFDEVCYTGDGNSSQTLSHNLGATPQLVLIKVRNSVYDWLCYSETTGTSNTLYLNLTNASTAYTIVTAPTSTTFRANNVANNVTETYVAYLFATCPGVSKVGSYTGTAALLTVDCGFTSGARFVLIKRTDSTGGWYTYDSARGITSGNDPYLLLNSTAAEVTSTNYVDTDTTGFKVTAAAPAELNANGGTYIFLAIA